MIIPSRLEEIRYLYVDAVCEKVRESGQVRGMHGVRLVISDDHEGLGAACRAVLGSVSWQRCQFHLQQMGISGSNFQKNGCVILGFL